MAKKAEENPIKEKLQSQVDKEASDFLGEDVNDGKVEEEKNPIEEKAEEIKKEPKPTEPPEEEIDIDELKNGIKEEVSKETTEKLLKALQGDKSEEIKDDELTPPWEKEGRNPKSYAEIAEWAADRADIINARRETEKLEAAKKEEEINKKNDEEKTAEYNKYVDEQLDDLYKSKKLSEDPKERENLFKTMLEVNQKRASEGKPLIYSVKEIFYEHYKPLNTQPAGADAPVSGGRSGFPQNETEEYSYKDVHSKSFLDFFKK